GEFLSSVRVRARAICQDNVVSWKSISFDFGTFSVFSWQNSDIFLDFSFKLLWIFFFRGFR
ncbi:MAG: hypothetical protein J6O18_00830, partial [Bacilli bacterium]|nr:hypothetical protein [Bacilli bacterium]